MRLDPDDIEAIAQRVAELVRDSAPPRAVRFVDAQTVARALNIDREWVYAHAHELGGMRLGGARGRLRFDLREVKRRLTQPSGCEPRETAIPPRPRSRRVPMTQVDLLPYER